MGCVYAWQVGWGFDAGMLRLLLVSSEFLVALTVGMGAQIGDADLAAVSRACPNLQRLTLRFAAVSGEGKEPPLFPGLLAALIGRQRRATCTQLHSMWKCAASAPCCIALQGWCP